MGEKKRAKKEKEKSAPVEIREMEIDDLPKVFALGEKLFRSEDAPNLYRTWDEYELIDSYSCEGEFCLVAETEDGALGGFVIGSIIEKRKSAWTYGYLVWIGVDPAMRRRGIAQRLITRLTDLLIEDGARIMMIDTDAENKGAIKLFQRLGFSNPVEHIYMTRNLTSLPEYKEQRELEAEEAALRKGRKRKKRRKDKKDGV